MGQPDHQLSEDYSYDLVHEIGPSASGQSGRMGRTQHDPKRSATGETDHDGDYGYDEAHDL
jgi:hypothetical protein